MCRVLCIEGTNVPSVQAQGGGGGWEVCVGVVVVGVEAGEPRNIGRKQSYKHVRENLREHVRDNLLEKRVKNIWGA